MIQDSSVMVLAHLKIGDSYFALKDYVNAVTSYQRGIELCEIKSDNTTPDLCSSIYFKISEAYLKLDQPNIAISFLKNMKGAI